MKDISNRALIPFLRVMSTSIPASRLLPLSLLILQISFLHNDFPAHRAANKQHTFFQIWKQSILPDSLLPDSAPHLSEWRVTHSWLHSGIIDIKGTKTVSYAFIWCVISVSWGCITIVVNGACEWCLRASHSVFPAAENVGAVTPGGRPAPPRRH